MTEDLCNVIIKKILLKNKLILELRWDSTINKLLSTDVYFKIFFYSKKSCIYLINFLIKYTAIRAPKNSAKIYVGVFK